MIERALSGVQMVGQIDFTVDVPMTELSQNTVGDLLQLFFAVIAAVAVLIIVIASLQFALSRGNADQANKARNAIIYAAIGLAVAVLANVIVTFVLDLV